MAFVVVRAALQSPRTHGKHGCVRSSAWIGPFIDAEDSARSGGFMKRPTISRTFSTSRVSGSFEGLAAMRL